MLYTRDHRGDMTTLTLRKPYLLKGAFGVLPRAPKYSAPSTTPETGTETQTKRKVTKAK